MKWNVVAVKPIAPLVIDVEFEDGLKGTVQFEQSHLTGVFSTLKDPLIFQQAYIDAGAVAWPGELDLAPDAMYQAIKSHGQWLLK